MIAAFLIVAIVVCRAFFLGPLAMLLLVSRPRTVREWFWIAASVGVLAAWGQTPDSFLEQTLRAAAACFTGAFIILTLAGMRSLFSRALLGVVLAALATTGWFVAFHLRFADLQSEIVAQAWDQWRQIFTTLPATPPPVIPDLLGADQSANLARQVASAVSATATLYPALLALLALLGSWLAWIWYHRVAPSPIGAPAKSFREFRFNDHLVWVLVIAVGLTLIHLSHPVDLVTENVLLVTLAVYWVRGLAVIRTALRRASPLVIGIAILIMLPAFAFVLVGFTLVGVADTWLDFRRRMAPPSGVPS